MKHDKELVALREREVFKKLLAELAPVRPAVQTSCPTFSATGCRPRNCSRTHSNHDSVGSPYGRNFSNLPCSSLENSARCRPSLLASGESIRLLESCTL